LPNGKWACRRHFPSAYFHPDVERCLYGCGVVRPPAPVLQGTVKKPVVIKPPAQGPPKVKKVVTLEPTRVLPTPPSPISEPPQRAAAPSWKGLAHLSDEALKEQNIHDLRKYARHHLGIIGASKIRGGKDVLIPLILAERARAAWPGTPPR
jgi:hypothetical protein